MEMCNIEVTLTDTEIRDFNELFARHNVCPAQKIGEMIHGFILAEGVKHQILSERLRKNVFALRCKTPHAETN